MLKINVSLNRWPDITYAEFNACWPDQHTPLLAAMTATQEVVRRYVQLHTTDVPPTAPYDGIADVWVDDFCFAAAIFASDHYNTVIADDGEEILNRFKACASPLRNRQFRLVFGLLGETASLQPILLHESN
jgi:hypothetical protein